MANRSNNKTLSTKLYLLVILMVKLIVAPNTSINKRYNSIPFIFAFLLMFAGISFSADAQTTPFTSSTSYTVPAGVSIINVQCWGAGGGGSTRTSNGQGGGGGGGAYASSQISVTAGSTYTIVVGNGGTANTAGGNSSFTPLSVTQATVLAAGGSAGANNAVTAGAGGTVAASTGTIRFAGGNGGTGNATAEFSGGGGGVAGSSGAGGNALGATAGTGTPTHVGSGGTGATGVSGSLAGNPGLIYGGGGSGGSRSSSSGGIGGIGAGGYVTITVINWCPPAFTSSVSNATGPIQFDGSVSVSNNVNPAMEFRKTDYDYIDLNTSLLSNLTQFSIEGWTKFNLADNVGTRVGSIFGQNDCIEFGFYDPNIIQCWTAGGGQVDIAVSSYPNDNAWHHIAAVGNGTTLKVYVDGLLIGSGGFSTANYGSSAFTTKIGGRIWDDTDGGSFTGQIKKIGFWNTALTTAQITMLAAGYYIYKTSDTGLIAGYNFFDGSGTVLSSMPAGKNGTLKNSPVWSNIMTYAWTKTGDPGFTPSTLNISSLTTGQYNLTVSNGTCSTFNSFTIISDNTCATYWTGATDSIWMKTSNWSAQYVPLDGAAVSFATTANNGTAAVNNLILDIDRTVSSLTNLSAKRLTIPPGRSLTVNTTITNNHPDQIYIQSNPFLPNGTLIFHNTVDAPVQATVEMFSLASWNLSNPAGSKYKWQYFGIPVRSLSTTTPLFDGVYVRRMNENDSPAHWQALTNASAMTSFTGYEISQEEAKTYVFKGMLENSDYNLVQPYTSGVTFPGQNLIANPYTAAIDIAKIVFGSQMQETIYLYNTGSRNEWINVGQGIPLDSTNNLTGQYTSVPLAHVGEAGLPQQIPSMQAFIVRAKMSSANATISIPYSTASTMVKNTDRQRVAVNSGDAISTWTRIDVKSSRFSDRMWIFTDANCTHDFDNGYDGEKFPGIEGTPQLYAMEDDGNYQVNTVNDINNSWLGFRAGADSIYTLTFRHQNTGSQYSNIYLIDMVNRKMTDITAGSASYTFPAKPNSPVSKRFKIITNYQEPEKSAASDPDNSKIMIFGSQQTLFIDNITAHDGNLLLYDLSGQFLSKFPFKANTVTIIDSGLSSGSYLSKAVTPYEKISRQFIMK